MTPDSMAPLCGYGIVGGCFGIAMLAMAVFALLPVLL